MGAHWAVASISLTVLTGGTAPAIFLIVEPQLAVTQDQPPQPRRKHFCVVLEIGLWLRSSMQLFLISLARSCQPARARQHQMALPWPFSEPASRSL